MGLDTSHNAWHGPYSSFSRWRCWLADIKGVNLLSMKGFGGDTEWTQYEDDPIYPLLNHSDCDGELTPKECALIAFGLSEVLKKADSLIQPDWDSHQKQEHNYNIELTNQFRKGCIDAFKKCETIEFH
jgi:hypothetical protein